MPALTFMKTRNTRGGQPGMFGDETVTRGNVNVKKVSNVLGCLGGHGGQGVLCSVTCVPLDISGIDHLRHRRCQETLDARRGE